MSDVKISGAWKHFGSFAAVKQVSFDVASGSFLSLLGPSGCGKTTTLRLIAGFETPDRGDILIGGQRVNEIPPWQRDLGVVFQHYALFPFLTVAKNVSFGLERRKLAQHEIRQRVAQALELVGLPHLETRYPRQLSGGQQQRVALARALVIEPKVLLLDEPLSNLDAKLRTEMRFELKRIQRETGVTTIFVTHDQEEALTMSDTIVVMNHGNIVGYGTPKSIWQAPKTEFVADFLGVENLFPASHIEIGRARLQTQSGHTEEVEFNIKDTSTLTANAAKKSQFILGIRSTEIVINEQMPADSVNSFVGTIKETNYRGTFFTYQIASSLSDQPVIASSQLEFAVGQQIYLQLPPTRLLPLEPNSNEHAH